MLDFKLLPGDKYDGRCAEIYITEKQFLVYHCSICDEIYATFSELLSHITNDHYENTKEYSEVEAKSLQNLVAQESIKKNQLATKELLLKTKKSNGNFAIVNKTQVKCEQTFKNYFLENVAEITKLNLALETETHPKLLKSNTNPAQRKKVRSLSSTLKSPIIGKAKINTLTLYQVIPNEERKYVCTVCGFAFKEKCNLRGHLLRHSNQKRLSCTVCPKTFFNKVEHRMHEYRHKGELPHLCAHCGMGFVSLGSLTKHIRKQHSAHHYFKCERCCKTFANFYQLQDHQPLHAKENDFHCSECAIAFKCKKIFKIDSKKNECSRKLSCETCDIKLNTASTSNNIQKQSFIDSSKLEPEAKSLITKDNNNDEE